jgi:hypothetical protein
MAPSVSAETPMKTESTLVEKLGLDDPRLSSLASDVEQIAIRLQANRNINSTSFGSIEERASDLKSLRLKARALSSLATTLLRLKLELLIADCE